MDRRDPRRACEQARIAHARPAPADR
jgi:hypothetical protein